MYTTENESPLYREMQERILELLKKHREALTVRQIRTMLCCDDFLGDALEILQFIGAISAEGSVLRPKYRYISEPSAEAKKKVCGNCLIEKPLLDFYQEWSGAPARQCKDCRINAQKKRGRRRAVKESDTDEVRPGEEF